MNRKFLGRFFFVLTAFSSLCGNASSFAMEEVQNTKQEQQRPENRFARVESAVERYAQSICQHPNFNEHMSFHKHFDTLLKNGPSPEYIKEHNLITHTDTGYADEEEELQDSGEEWHNIKKEATEQLKEHHLSHALCSICIDMTKLEAQPWQNCYKAYAEKDDTTLSAIAQASQTLVHEIYEALDGVQNCHQSKQQWQNNNPLTHTLHQLESLKQKVDQADTLKRSQELSALIHSIVQKSDAALGGEAVQKSPEYLENFSKEMTQYLTTTQADVYTALSNRSLTNFGKGISAVADSFDTNEGLVMQLSDAIARQIQEPNNKTFTGKIVNTTQKMMKVGLQIRVSTKEESQNQ